MEIQNVPFNVATALTNSLSEVFAVAAPNVSATVNIGVISTLIDTDIQVELALVPSNFNTVNGSLSPEHYAIPKNLKIGPTGVNSGMFEYSAIVVPAGMKLVGKASSAGLTARVHGYYRREVA